MSKARQRVAGVLWSGCSSTFIVIGVAAQVAAR